MGEAARALGRPDAAARVADRLAQRLLPVVAFVRLVLLKYADVPFGALIDDQVADHGYALTVHKAQGSQWRRVIVCIERGRGDSEEFRRWLYTAVTRAVEEVVLVEM